MIREETLYQAAIVNEMRLRDSLALVATGYACKSKICCLQRKSVNKLKEFHFIVSYFTLNCRNTKRKL